MKKRFKPRFYVFCAIFLILIFLGLYSIFNLFTNSENSNSVSNQAETNSYTESNNSTEPETPPSTTIKVSVIGDIMCHNSQYIDAYNSDSGTYDFSYVFEDIKQYIESADLAIGNLETTFAGPERGYTSYPTFNTPEALATDLKELGIDVVSTANNHSLDKGYSGLCSTIDYLDEVRYFTYRYL